MGKRVAVILLCTVLIFTAWIAGLYMGAAPRQLSEETGYTVTIDEQTGSAYIYVRNYSDITEGKSGLFIKRRETNGSGVRTAGITTTTVCGASPRVAAMMRKEKDRW